MNGHVREWCADWYDPNYGLTKEQPKGTATGTLRVLRGGSWIDDARYARSASRNDGYENKSTNADSFRIIFE